MKITLAQQLDYIDNCVIRVQKGELDSSKAIERIDTMISLVPKLTEHGQLAQADIRKGITL